MAPRQPRKTRRGAGRLPFQAFARRITPKQTRVISLPKRQEHGLINLAKKAKKFLRTRVLFSGPSGTGKTLAAKFLARQLEVPLYQIDLSGVVSKYIGETEKNMRRLFDAAEASNAVLLFDEADALFGKRSEVKDSHDRYANSALDYLCERLDNFKGLAILACNRHRALDLTFTPKTQFRMLFRRPVRPSAKRNQR